MSDERLKKDIKDFDIGLDAIMKIDPKTFKYNGKSIYAPDNDKSYVGLIAQDINQTALGQWTISLGEDGYYRYDSNAIIYALINAVQEQQVQIDTLANGQSSFKVLVSKVLNTEEKIEKQDQKIHDLEERLVQLEKSFQTIADVK